MKKTVVAVLLCAVLLAAGCSAPGSGSSGADSDAQKKQEAAVQETKETAQTEDAAGAGESVQEQEATASADDADQPAGSAEAVSTEEKSAEAKDSAQKEELEKSAETEDTAQKEEKEESAEAVTAEKASAEEDAEEDKTEAAPAEKTADKEASAEKTAEKAAEAEKEEAAEEPAEEDEPVPDGFTPYGNYLLVYDSGYEVKSRYSEAGLTFYMESEEFRFILDKNLPNFPGKVAHMLFYTEAPMDPAEAEGETFPFDEHYTMYIDLEDGSSYTLSRDQLDLKGRIFVRDLYESFREQWEGAF